MSLLNLSRKVALITALLLFLHSKAHAFTGGAAGGCWFAKAGRGTAENRQHTRRSLLQSNCGLQYGNEVLSFSSCKNISSDLGTDFNLLWTVVEDGNGNSTLRAAIDAAQSSGSADWAGFGINSAMEMVGGSALIVKACSTCSSGASISDYYLGGYSSREVQPPGWLSVHFKSAALSNGRLQGVFEVSLNATGNALQSVDALYAVGPLGSDGELQQHEFNVAEALDLSAGLASSLGPALAPSPSASSPGAAAQAPSPTSTRTTVATAGGPARAPGPSSGESCTLQFAGNNSVLTFARCQSLTTSTTANSGFRLFWTLSPSPNGNGTVMDGAIESGSSSSWAGFGVPTSPGEMVGANAIIVKPCSSCQTGASADNYLLNGYSSSDVVAGTGRLNLTNLQAARSSSGEMQSTFKIFMSQNIDQLDTSTNIIASVGPVDSRGNLQPHPVSNAYSGTVNLASGTLSVQTSGADRKPTVHAILMIVAWGLLLPLGIVLARCKEWGPIWFHLHRIIQALGYLAGVAGAAVGVAMGRPNGTELENNHRIVGLVVFILLTIQVLAIFWRPAPRPTKLRYSWNVYHWALGGAAVLLAFANVFIGLKIAGEPAKWSGLYALGFALILILYAGKVSYNLTALRKRQRNRQPLGTMSGPHENGENGYHHQINGNV